MFTKTLNGVNWSRSVIIPARRWFFQTGQTGSGESVDRSRGRTKKITDMKMKLYDYIYLHTFKLQYHISICKNLRYWTCMRIRNHLLLPLPNGCWKVNPIASLAEGDGMPAWTRMHWRTAPPRGQGIEHPGSGKAGVWKNPWAFTHGVFWGRGETCGKYN